MALALCPDCNGKLSTSAKACPHCGRPMGTLASSAKPFATKADFVGGLLFLAGVSGAVYFFLFFKTTVDTSLGELHNVGLLADRQNGLIASGIVAVLGLVVGFAGHRK